MSKICSNYINGTSEQMNATYGPHNDLHPREVCCKAGTTFSQLMQLMLTVRPFQVLTTSYENYLNMGPSFIIPTLSETDAINIV